MTAFHEVQFPPDISLGSKGGPERRTDVVTLRSGGEERNSIWADARHKYQAGYGIKTFTDMQKVLVFFQERRGRLYGFRWRDHFDHASSAPGAPVTPLDQRLGTGDGATRAFPLTKLYGGAYAPWFRTIAKPVANTVVVAVNGASQLLGAQFTVDTTTGIVTFLAGAIPAAGAAITAGFQFDVPVRFDTDYLEIEKPGTDYGEIPNIPIVEIRP